MKWSALRVLAAWLVLSSMPLLTQASSVEAELRRCRGVTDIQARVACYDAIALPGGQIAAAEAPVNASAPTAAASQPVRDFGLPERPVTALPQSIDSAIEGEFDGWTPGARLRLANGQVWEIVDGSTASYQLRDPKVRISRGLLGSFFINIEGVAQSPRVRRVR